MSRLVDKVFEKQIMNIGKSNWGTDRKKGSCQCFNIGWSVSSVSFYWQVYLIIYY